MKQTSQHQQPGNQLLVFPHHHEPPTINQPSTSTGIILTHPTSTAQSIHPAHQSQKLNLHLLPPFLVLSTNLSISTSPTQTTKPNQTKQLQNSQKNVRRANPHLSSSILLLTLTLTLTRRLLLLPRNLLQTAHDPKTAPHHRDKPRSSLHQWSHAWLWRVVRARDCVSVGVGGYSGLFFFLLLPFS